MLKEFEQEWEFEFQHRGNVPFLMAEFWTRSFISHYQKALNLPVGDINYLFVNNKGFINKNDKKKILDLIDKNLDGYVDYVIKHTLRSGKNFKSVVSECLEEGNIKEQWSNFTEAVLSLVPWFYIPWYIIEENYLTKKLNNLSDEEIFLACLPQEDFMTTLEQKFFIELLEGKKSIESYIEKFGWMNTYCFDTQNYMTTKMVKKKIKEANLSEYKNNLEKRKSDLKKGIELFNSLDHEQKEIVEKVRSLAYTMSYSVESGLENFAKAIPFYKKIAEKIKVDYEDWTNYSIEEITSMLNGQKIDKKIRLDFVVMLKDKKLKFDIGNSDEYLKVLEKFEKTNTVKGSAVSSGNVTGKIRILDGAGKMHIEKGEILVTSMTSPVFLPQMKISAAIVTDEGGLLCHAAIVSRELGKPCIVGTKNATKAFKDGDLVEVDADNGIVKKI